MPSSYTPRNRLEKQAAGENNNTWGTRLNDNVIELQDEALDGIVSFNLSGTKVLTSNNAATDEARKRVLNITGGTGGNVVIPNVEKAYVVRNASGGNVTIGTGIGTSATIPAGALAMVISVGSNLVYAANDADFGSQSVQSTGSAKFARYDRPSAGKGYLWSSASDTSPGSNPIIVMDGSPNDTDLGNMYGAGFARLGTTSFLSAFNDGGFSTWGIYVANQGVAGCFMSGEGNIHAKNNYYVNGNFVIRGRKTGWSTPSGSSSRSTFDPSTVTLSQLAQRVAALINDLHGSTGGHGLIGT